MQGRAKLEDIVEEVAATSSRPEFLRNVDRAMLEVVTTEHLRKPFTEHEQRLVAAVVGATLFSLAKRFPKATGEEN